MKSPDFPSPTLATTPPRNSEIHPPCPPSPLLSLQMSLQLNCLTTSTTAVPPFRCLFYIPIPTLCRNNTRFRQSRREYTLFHSCIQLACLLCFDFLFFFSPFFQAPKPVASRFSKVVFFFIFFFSILSFRRFFVFKYFPEFPVSASSFHKVWT